MLNIGILGCANIAVRSMIPAMVSSGKFRVVSIASRNSEKARPYSECFDCELDTYDSLLNRTDIDSIYVPLPTGMHFYWIKRALEKGLHVLAEKSIGLNIRDVSHLVDLAKEKNVALYENYMFVHHRQQKVLKDCLTRIGDLHSVELEFGFPPLEPDNFRYNKELGGGALLDAGGYPIRAMSLLFKDFTAELVGANLKLNNKGVDITGHAAFLLRNQHRTVWATLGWGFDNSYRCGVRAWGQKGSLVTERTFTAKPGFSPSLEMEFSGVKEVICMHQDDHFEKSVIAFFKSTQDYSIRKNDYLNVLSNARIQADIREKAIKSVCSS